MAGDWIKMRVDLDEDPAVVGMAIALDTDEHSIVGRLHKLWSWADKHCTSGHAKSVTLGWINRHVGLPKFAEAMVSQGWLTADETGVTFPNFDRHNGKSAKTRAETTERKRRERANKDVTDSAQETSQQNCDERVTREEKRREELTSKALVPGDAGDQPPSPVKSVAKPDCPHQAIIELYHEHLPQCPRIRDWTPARQQHLRARWNEDAKRQNLDYWKRFFEYVAECDFLVGKSGKTPFFADLEWMVTQKNFTKIREEKYANRKAA